MLFAPLLFFSVLLLSTQANARYFDISNDTDFKELLDELHGKLSSFKDYSSTIDKIIIGAELYAFTSDLRSPPAGFAKQGDLVLSVDLIEELKEAKSIEFPYPFDFFIFIQRLWAKARDAHTSFAIPYEYYDVYPFFPVPLCPRELDNSELKISVCESLYTHTAGFFNYIGKNYSEIRGKDISSINGLDPVQYLQNFADTRFFTGRDPSQRFENLIRNGPIVLDWYQVLEEGDIGSFSQVSKPNIEFVFDDGTSASVPFGVLKSETAQSMGLLGVVQSRLPQFSGLNLTLLTKTKPQSKMFATRNFADTAKTNLFSALNLLSSARDAVDGYIKFAEIDGVCVISINTFSPSQADDWMSQLEQALKQAKNANCAVTNGTREGLPLGKPLVFDFRRNGGGSTDLLAAFTNGVFPDYTPHHESTYMLRMGSNYSDDFLWSLYYQDFPILEPFTLQRHEACSANNSFCGKWWRKNTVTRTYPDNTTETWSPIVVAGAQYWDVEGDVDYDWAKTDSAYKKYGFMASEIVDAKRIQKVGFVPAPELTTFVFGPLSASCTAHVANIASEYKLGAIARTGSRKQEALMAAMVPGGDVIQLSSFTPTNLPYGSLSVSSFAVPPLVTTTDERKMVPYEFVKLPPQFRIPIWTLSFDEGTDDDMISLISAMNKTNQPLTTCTPGIYAASFGSDCELIEGAVRMGRLCTNGKYEGECGPALCKFGWEAVGGKCVLRSEPASPSQTATIVGSSVGAAAVVAIIGVLIGCCKKGSCSSKVTPTSDSTGADDTV